MPYTTHGYINSGITPIFSQGFEAANVNFTLTSHRDFHKIGHQDRGTVFEKSKGCYAKYNLSYNFIKPSDYNAFRGYLATLRGTQYVLFNDFSDNYIYGWQNAEGSVKQFGKVLPIPNDPGRYRGYKFYTVGDRYASRPIYGYLPEAEVKLNNLTTGFTLNRNTGIFTGTSGASSYDLETDGYLVPVVIEDEQEFKAEYDLGADMAGLTNVAVVNNADLRQNFSFSVNLREIVRAASHSLPLFDKLPTVAPDLGLFTYRDFLPLSIPITDLSLDDFTRESTISEDFLKPTKSIDGYSTVYDPSTLDTLDRVTVTPGLVKHRQLIMFINYYRVNNFTFT